MLLHICDTYNCDYMPHTTFRFYAIDFQLNTDLSSQFYHFLPWNHLTLLKHRFLKKMLKKSKNLSAFFSTQNYSLK